MKKIIKNQISYILVFLVAICLTLVPVQVKAATTNDDIITVVPKVENSLVTVTGTTGADVVAVLVEIFDKDDNLVTMETHRASNGTYEASFDDLALTEGATYLFYVANFNGKGKQASAEYEVPKKPAEKPETKPDTGSDTKPDTGSDTKPETGSDTKPDTGSDTKPDTGTDTKPETGSDTKPDTGSDTKPDTGTDTKPETKPTVPAGTVITSSSDSTTALKDNKGILPENTKLETKKVTEQTTVDKLTVLVTNELKDAVQNDKELKQVAVYELNLFDGATEIHQLADKVEVTINLPFEVSPNGKLLVYRVDGDKLVLCASKISDGKVIFETDHFSTYLFVEVQDTPTVSTPITGDLAVVLPLVIVLVAGIAIGGVAFVRYRRRQTR